MVKGLLARWRRRPRVRPPGPAPRIAMDGDMSRRIGEVFRVRFVC
jgi:hypothetical protein